MLKYFRKNEKENVNSHVQLFKDNKPQKHESHSQLKKCEKPGLLLISVKPLCSPLKWIFLRCFGKKLKRNKKKNYNPEVLALPWFSKHAVQL